MLFRYLYAYIRVFLYCVIKLRKNWNKGCLNFLMQLLRTYQPSLLLLSATFKPSLSIKINDSEKMDNRSFVYIWTNVSHFLKDKNKDVFIHHVDYSSIYSIHWIVLHIRTTTTFFSLTSITNVFTIAGYL